MIVPPVGDVRPVQTDAEILAESPLPTAEGFAVGIGCSSASGHCRTWRSVLFDQGSLVAVGSGRPVSS